MDRLSIFLTLKTGSVLVGSFVIAVLALGYYSWQPMAGAIALGLVLTWPVAYAISRLIKRNDPGWTARSGSRENERASRPTFRKPNPFCPIDCRSRRSWGGLDRRPRIAMLG